MRKLSVMTILVAACVAVLVTGAPVTQERRETSAGADEGGWKYKCFNAGSAQPAEAAHVLERRVLVHSIIYANGVSAGTGTFGQTAAGAFFSRKPVGLNGPMIIPINASPSQTIQVNLDVVLDEGLWFVGGGVFTVLYKELP